MSLNNFVVCEVSDPTDFGSSSTLQSLDHCLRCPICKEFYDGPVSSLCGHTFCSLCLREYLGTKQECPLCRVKVNESQLRPNVVIEDIVSLWKGQARSELLLRYGSSKETKNATTRKRATPPSSSSEVDDPSMPGPSSLRKRPRLDDNLDSNPDPIPTDTVSCPVCQRLVLLEKVNDHLDSGCKKYLADTPKVASNAQWSKFLGNQKNSKSTPPNSVPQPLPKVSYDTLKDKQIKDLLSKASLPTTGDRASLISRHQRWVTIFNANLDKAPVHQSSEKDMRLLLKRREEETKRKSKKAVIDDPVAYQRAHKSEFDTLVAEVQARKPPSTPQIPTSPPEQDVIILDSDSL